jgi:hypothetical protein
MRVTSLFAALLLATLCARPASATTITLSQAELLAAVEVTTLFGGNGQVVSRVADGDGVLFTIQGGTIDFGKVALRVLLSGAARDLSGYEAFGLRFDVVSAPNPVELNPFVFTGTSGTQFYQDVPGVKVQGDSFTSFVPLAGISQPQNGHSLGFQYFTAGNVLEPPAQLVQIRVSPVPVPEPRTWRFLLFTLLLVALVKRLGLVASVAPETIRCSTGESCTSS